MVAWLVAPIVVTVVLMLVFGARLFFNTLSPAMDRRRRERDDNYFMASCHSGALARYRWFNRHLPSSPRCRFCLAPFGGLGRVVGIKPSRKNPNYCRGCFEMAPLGGQDMEVGVLFADLRGFTAWCEGRPPEVVARTLNEFYEIASEVITGREGLVDKLVGDEVMGLFLPAFPSLRERTCEVMVGAAQQLMLRTSHLSGSTERLGIGIGLNFGVTRVGNVGVGEVKDFTAVGDEVNLASRLQDCAAAGEIVMSSAVHDRLGDPPLELSAATLNVKGKAEPVTVYSTKPAR